MYVYVCTLVSCASWALKLFAVCFLVLLACWRTLKIIQIVIDYFWMSTLFAWFEFQCNTIHTVSFSCGGRPVIEDMTQMSVASWTDDFYTYHERWHIFNILYTFFAIGHYCIEEGRPAGSRLVFLERKYCLWDKISLALEILTVLDSNRGLLQQTQ